MHAPGPPSSQRPAVRAPVQLATPLSPHCTNPSQHQFLRGHLLHPDPGSGWALSGAKTAESALGERNSTRHTHILPLHAPTYAVPPRGQTQGHTASVASRHCRHLRSGDRAQRLSDSIERLWSYQQVDSGRNARDSSRSHHSEGSGAQSSPTEVSTHPLHHRAICRPPSA